VQLGAFVCPLSVSSTHVPPAYQSTSSSKVALNGTRTGASVGVGSAPRICTCGPISCCALPSPVPDGQPVVRNGLKVVLLFAASPVPAPAPDGPPAAPHQLSIASNAAVLL